MPLTMFSPDRGGEFSSNLLRAFCRAEGINQTFTLLASPQQNGIAERRIGMVMDVARTSMIHAAAPHFLWPFAVQYATHQINLQPHVSLPETTPTMRWTGKVGDASMFRVWGSRAFVRDTLADKLSSCAVCCVFLGFPLDAPGWQFYHPTSRRALSTQDVTFDESVSYYRLFPYHTASLPPPPLFLALGTPPVDPLPPQGPAPSGVSKVDPVEPVKEAVDSGAARDAKPASAGTGGVGCGVVVSQGAEPGGAEPERVEARGSGPGGAEFGSAEPGGTEPERAESGGSPGVPAGATGGAAGHGAARGVVAGGAAGGNAGAGAAKATGPRRTSLRAASPTVTRFLATTITDPLFESIAMTAFVAQLVDFAAPCRLDYATSLVAKSASVCPPSVGGKCALSMDVLEDRQEEFECFTAAVPHLVSMLLGPKGDPDAPDIPTPCSYAEAIELPYSSQWVKRPLGSPPIFKARYIARGFSQQQGVDFFQTFSPTPKMTTLRVLLHVAAKRDYKLHSLDFSTAFLQGSLHEEIWLRRPPGFTGSFPAGTQWSLRRPVYGLRQAPRERHDTLRMTLAALGFAPSTADPSLFLRTDTTLPPIYVLVYVSTC
ncbi:unnamed protein product [Closterium sp. NIES-53]